MSDRDGAEEDPCQGEHDLLGALEARLIELGLGSKGNTRDPAPPERPSSLPNGPPDVPSLPRPRRARRSNTMSTCPRCGAEQAATVPEEPPIGTWVKDRHGAVSLRYTVDGVTGWAPRGAMPYGMWEAMWEVRGPLTVCGPWGADLEPVTA